MNPQAPDTKQDLRSGQRITDETAKEGEARHAVDRCAVFVVHGIGQPELGATAASMRSGFEKARVAIREWQREHPIADEEDDPELIPAPFVWSGYWGDYADIEKTSLHIGGPEREALYERYADKWRRGEWKTFWWAFGQLKRLNSQRVREEVGPGMARLYRRLQPVGKAAMVAVGVFWRGALRRYLTDIRVYLDPGDTNEKTIVDLINHKVGAELLRMMGVDWEFRSLAKEELIDVSGTPVRFERVVWVAHSLGSVISYNVLSKLFRLAAEIEREGDEEQKRNVARFRRTLKRFVTIGSPLDKVAFLYGANGVKPWPDVDRSTLLEAGEKLDVTDPDRGEWWINFFHELDPVSGALSAPLICEDDPPLNLRMDNPRVSLRAHCAYWKDPSVARYIFSRTYGKEYVRDRDHKRYPMKPLLERAQRWYACMASLVWGLLIAIIVIIGGIVWWILR